MQLKARLRPVLTDLEPRLPPFYVDDQVVACLGGHTLAVGLDHKARVVWPSLVGTCAEAHQTDRLRRLRRATASACDVTAISFAQADGAPSTDNPLPPRPAPRGGPPRRARLVVTLTLLDSLSKHPRPHSALPAKEAVGPGGILCSTKRGPAQIAAATRRG